MRSKPVGRGVIDVVASLPIVPIVADRSDIVVEVARRAVGLKRK